MKRIIVSILTLALLSPALLANTNKKGYCQPLVLTEDEKKEALEFSQAGLLLKDYLKARKLYLDPANYQAFRQNRVNKTKGTVYLVIGIGAMVNSLSLAGAGVYAAIEPEKAHKYMADSGNKDHRNWADHLTVDDTKKAGIAVGSIGGATLITGLILTIAGSKKLKNSHQPVTRKDGIRIAFAPRTDGASFSVSSMF